MKKQLLSIFTAVILILSAAAPAVSHVYADVPAGQSLAEPAGSDTDAAGYTEETESLSEAPAEDAENETAAEPGLPSSDEGTASDGEPDDGISAEEASDEGSPDADSEENEADEEDAAEEEAQKDASEESSSEDAAEEETEKDSAERESGEQEKTEEETDADSSEKDGAAQEETGEDQDPSDRSIEECSITLSAYSYFYSGKDRKPAVVVTDGNIILQEYKDYQLSYEDNKNVGTAKVTVTGTGDYSGSAVKEFTIKSKSIAGAGVSVNISRTEYFYTGAARTPSVSVTFNDISLKKDRDFTVIYRNNKNAGTAKAIVKGTGNYKGTVRKEFIIKEKSINGSGVSVSLSVTKCVYKGSPMEPKVKITYSGKILKKDRDYTVVYKSNNRAGTAAAIITGTGNYKGKVKKTFTITRKSLAEDKIKISLSGTSFEWTGKAITPAVTVAHRGRKLVIGKDYEVTYRSNINAGTAAVLIKGIGSYKGGVKKTFRIRPYKDPEFSLKGPLVLTAEDANGIKNVSFYDKKDNACYLFLTRSTDVSSLVLHYTGVELDKSSKGRLDKIRHTINIPLTSDSGHFAVREKNGTIHRIRIYRSDLPNVCITLNGTTLEEVNAGTKNDKHPGNSVIITDSSGKVNAEEQSSVELKGRGNSTWLLSDKKPYQFKFSEKTDVLGMGKAKKWVLLANSFDDSLMKNKIAFEAANEMTGWWACSFEYCDLWIDGQYLGNYIIGQKNEIGSTRLDLHDRNGILVEMDNVYWALEDEKDQIKKTYWDCHFVVSDVVDEDHFDSAVKCFTDGMDDMVRFFDEADRASTPLSEIDRYIDVEDAALYYLVNEFFNNRESFGTSFYFYRDGYSDSIHVGPIWDFDSAFCSTDYNAGPVREGYHCDPFESLLEFDSFSVYLAQMYDKYSGTVFKESSGMVSRMKKAIKRSAFMNYRRWDFLGKKNGKSSEKDFENTFGLAASKLANWLKSRYRCFDPLQDISSPALYAYLNGQELTLNITNLKDYGYSSVAAHIWSEVNGDDDLKIYPMSYFLDGSYEVSVNLGLHGDTGLYHAAIYGIHEDGSEQQVAVSSVNLKTVSEPLLTVKKGIDGKIYVSLAGASGIESPKVAVWGDENNQDDLKWYSMKSTGSGTFAEAVNQSNHKETGKYHFHIYGYNGGSDYVFLDAAAASIYKPTVKLTKTKFRYTGVTVKPEAVVRYGDKILVQGTDYSVEYRNNIKAGTAYVIITGKGAYSGRVVESFLIIDS